MQTLKKSLCAHWLLGATNVRLRHGGSDGEILVDEVNLASAQVKWIFVVER